MPEFSRTENPTFSTESARSGHSLLAIYDQKPPPVNTKKLAAHPSSDRDSIVARRAARFCTVVRLSRCQKIIEMDGFTTSDIRAYATKVNTC